MARQIHQTMDEHRRPELVSNHQSGHWTAGEQVSPPHVSGGPGWAQASGDEEVGLYQEVSEARREPVWQTGGVDCDRVLL